MRYNITYKYVARTSFVTNNLEAINKCVNWVQLVFYCDP